MLWNVVVWLGLSTKTTWLGLGKDRGLGTIGSVRLLKPEGKNKSTFGYKQDLKTVFLGEVLYQNHFFRFRNRLGLGSNMYVSSNM